MRTKSDFMTGVLDIGALKKERTPSRGFDPVTADRASDVFQELLGSYKFQCAMEEYLSGAISAGDLVGAIDSCAEIENDRLTRYAKEDAESYRIDQAIDESKGG